MEGIETKLVRAPVNVAQLLKEPVGSTRSYDLIEMIEDESEDLVQGSAQLIHTDRGILVRGLLRVEIELTCSRCLSRFSSTLDFAVEEEFLPTVDMSSGLALLPPEQAEEFTIDSKNILDLGELIRQYTLLNLPMKPLCRPDCSGIKEMNRNGGT